MSQQCCTEDPVPSTVISGGPILPESQQASSVVFLSVSKQSENTESIDNMQAITNIRKCTV